MLDFAKPNQPTPQLRCQRRARAARQSARVLLVALGGLVGCALALEPRMVTEMRKGSQTVMADMNSALSGIGVTANRFAPAVPVDQGPLSEPATDQIVTRADTSLLRP